MWFEQLQSADDIPASNVFENVCSHDSLENMYNSDSQGAISYFYQTIQRHADVKTSALKQKWATKLS